MTKTNAITIEEFKTAVMNANQKLVESVKDSTNIIEDIYKTNANYAVQTATSFAIKRLKKAKSDETATDVKGFVIGKKMQGTTGKGPTIFAVMTGKTGIAIKTWRGEVDTGDKKIKFPVDCATKLKIKIERNDFTDKDEYIAANVIGRNPIERHEILKRLESAGAILSLDDVRKLIKKTSPEPVVMVKVTIAGATASKKFGSDITQPIWFTAESEGKISAEGPNLSLRTRKTENETMAWIRVIGTAQEFIEVEDFVEITKDTIQRFDDPEDQAMFLGSAMEDRTIIVVGSVSKIGGDNENGYQINLNAFALFEDIAETTPIVVGQQPLPTEEEEKPVEDAPLLEDAQPMAIEDTPPMAIEDAPPMAIEDAPTVEIEETKVVIEEPPVVKTKQMEEIENKLLFCACIKTGKAKNNSPRSAKIQALKETSLSDLRMMGAIQKLDAIDEALVTSVYEYMIKE